MVLSTVGANEVEANEVEANEAKVKANESIAVVPIAKEYRVLVIISRNQKCFSIITIYITMPRKGKGRLSKFDYNSLLKNRNVLYVVLVIAVANLFGYLMLKQLDAVAFFIIIGFLTTYFSKNMIIVMLTSMISTFILVQIKLLGRVREGFDASGNSTGSDTGSSTGTDGGTGTGSDGSSTDGGSDTGSGTGTGSDGGSSTPPDALSSSEISISDKMRATITAPLTDLKANSKDSPESFQQQLNPARYNANDDDDTPRHKPKIDYAATLESAYDNLDKLLSSDAIRNMTSDTGRLAEKQKQLMGNIEKLTPIMDRASDVLKNLDIGSLMGGLQSKLSGMGGIQDKLAGFFPDAKPKESADA